MMCQGFMRGSQLLRLLSLQASKTCTRRTDESLLTSGVAANTHNCADCFLYPGFNAIF